jgi:hypothetical protein
MESFIVDFQLREEVLREDVGLQPHLRPIPVLFQTFFVMPMRLRVGGMELFEAEGESYRLPRTSGVEVSAPWIFLPLLGMASGGLKALRGALDRGESSMLLPSKGGSTIVLSYRDGSLTIYSGLNGARGTAPYDVSFDSWLAFARKVLDMATKAVPELRHRSDLWEQFAPQKVDDLSLG